MKSVKREKRETMRVALATDSLVEGQGAMSTTVRDLARSLRHRRHEVAIYTAAKPSHEQLDSDIIGLQALGDKRVPGEHPPLDAVK